MNENKSQCKNKLYCIFFHLNFPYHRFFIDLGFYESFSNRLLETEAGSQQST